MTCSTCAPRGGSSVPTRYTARLDDDFVDPLEFRPDSLRACQASSGPTAPGHVAIANAFGTGVADDKAIYRFVPEMIRFYLGEEPILENVPTYLLTDPEVLQHVLDRLDQLVVKPTGESGGRGVMIGPHQPRMRRSRGCAGSSPSADPERWIAQDVVRLSTVPTLGADGILSPRHVDLRPFAVFGERIDIVPGGLTRVALDEGSLIVNSSRGGGSKDTWVLEDGDHADRAGPPIADTQPPALPDLRGPTESGPDSSSNSSSSRATAGQPARCSPGSNELYLLGRNLARAELTPPAPSRQSSRPSCRAPGRHAGVSFGSGGLLVMLGDANEGNSHGLGQLTLDADSELDDRVDRARERAPARCAMSRAEMWEAINTTALGLEAAGSPGGAHPLGPRSPRSTSRNAPR